jgi:hypothetical protein
MFASFLPPKLPPDGKGRRGIGREIEASQNAESPMKWLLYAPTRDGLGPPTKVLETGALAIELHS